MLRRLCLLTGVLLLACMPADGKTLKEMMDWLHETRKVNFVYDASLDVSMEYRGPSLERLSTKKALRQLFAGTGIEYQIKDSYVILKGGKRKNVSLTSKYVVREQRQSHTLSGFVRSGNGEPLLNATVYDLTGGIGTTTNEYGFFALTLPEGDHQLRYSYIGHAEKVERLSLLKDRHVDIELGVDTKLPEVVVTGDLNSPLLTTQTGKRSLLQQDIKTEYALLSTPDLVKTLQRGSGVAEGMELMSGMYVHGGNGDENLFLLDGTPLYDINHAAGLFSSFNPDVVKNVDFYKSGFPARYGGRLSSVVDVRTKDGDMEHLHGSYRIGMIDVGVHLEGPIVKGKTSYNIGLRRSYSDFVMALIPWSDNEDEDVSLGYYFMDLNAKVSHRFNPRSKLSLSLYYGNDSYHTKSSLAAPYSSCWNPDDGTVTEYGWQEDYSRYKLNWGNLNAALDWNCQLSPRLLANFTAVYTRNRARLYGFGEQKNRAEKENAEGETVVSTEHSYDNTIDDMGYRAAFDLRPGPRHKVRFGHDYTCHIFRPQTMRIHDRMTGFGETADTVQMNSHNRQTGHELTLYAEDEMQLSPRWSVNAGMHASLFAIGGKTFVNADPRLAVKYQLSNTVSLKASLTRMTQYMHKLQNTYLSLPTATAATTIPRKVEARIDGVVPDVKNADDYHSCNRMSATFKDDGSATDFYMVRIAERRMAGMAVGRDREDPTVLGREFQANSYDDYLAYKDEYPYWDFSQLKWRRHYVGINTGSDPVFNSISKLDEEFGFDWYEYSGMAYFFNDQLFNGRPYTLRLDIYKDSYSSDDRYNFRLWDDYAGCYFYILQFYKLSTEYYRYIKSKNDQENSDWADSGLMSARPSYTNVRGGLGVVAGYAASSATWRVEVKESEGDEEEVKGS